MELVLEILLWASLAGVLLTYVGYPLLLIAARPLARPRRIVDSEPTVSFVISAFNEAAVIADKLDNTLTLDYPRDRLEVAVISDASDDGTDGIVANYADRGVALHRQSPRTGKSMGLTRFVPQLTGEFVVFSDANSMYERDAVRKLVRHFADPSVGFAVGHQRYYADGTDAAASESLYWRYETFLKIQESRIGSVVCGDGAIYAIRRELFEPLRADDINDLYLPLRIVARGFRGVFDAEAVCYERTAATFSGEFRRKVRIINRSLRAVLRVPQVLNPFRVGRFAWQLGIHKVLRWFVPFLLIAALLANIPLAARGQTFYQWLLGLQIAFYSLACLRPVAGIGSIKPVYLASYFCLMNLAAFFGVLSCLFGSRIAVWQPERAEALPSQAPVNSPREQPSGVA
ncbi:MAG: glycosyltransferase family 2 protein [Planctomyces sp.]|nr:glycosyltransferase family 2 protein [Planctomyces sp.]